MPSLINMENSPEEARAENGIPEYSDGPKYPWGLQIDLNDESLDKLGVKVLPAVGTQVTIIAKATVSSTSEHASEQNGPCASMSLQITDMQVDGLEADLFGRAADMLYGKKK